jgi:hypothetical protein
MVTSAPNIATDVLKFVGPHANILAPKIARLNLFQVRPGF